VRSLRDVRGRCSVEKASVLKAPLRRWKKVVLRGGDDRRKGYTYSGGREVDGRGGKDNLKLTTTSKLEMELPRQHARHSERQKVRDQRKGRSILSYEGEIS